MSETPRTKAATRMAFSGEYMVEIEEAQKLERELAEVNEKLRQHASMLKSSDAHNNDMFCKLEKERELHSETKSELAEVTKQRDALAAAMKRIERHGVIMGSTGDYRQGQLDALKSVEVIASEALADTKGGSHDPLQR